MPEVLCPDCGATVDLAIDAESGERVPLDLGVELGSKAPCYTYVNNHEVTRSGKQGVPDHRFDCPGHNAGR